MNVGEKHHGPIRKSVGFGSAGVGVGLKVPGGITESWNLCNFLYMILLLLYGSFLYFFPLFS